MLKDVKKAKRKYGAHQKLISHPLVTGERELNDANAEKPQK